MLTIIGMIVVASPALLLATFGISMLLGFRLSERMVAHFTQASVVTALLSALSILATMLLTDVRHVPVELGHWVSIPEEHFHFTLKFVFDRLSVPFIILTFVLCGVIGAFASRYLHRDEGYHRFFLFYALFQLGMVLSSLAGTIETLFLGWELVGLSSALLVAFFHNRENPVRNGLRVWSVYRFADAAFLLGALVLHHLTGGGDFAELTGSGPWPEGVATISPTNALIVGLLLLVAAAGKSALIPFSGWLPRAMEGPTPSSAVFYGALSVHLGAFLLLRVSPLLDISLPLRIVVEIGCGLRYIALSHIIGHACMRTLQLLRAPSLLKDYHALENDLGQHVPVSVQEGFWRRRVSRVIGVRLYRFSLERGCMDTLLDQYLVRPFTNIFMWSDKMEHRWTEFLSREQRPSAIGPSLNSPTDAVTAHPRNENPLDS